MQHGGSSNITVISNDGKACFLIIVCNYMKLYTCDVYMSNLVLQLRDLNMGTALSGIWPKGKIISVQEMDTYSSICSSRLH